MAEEEDKKMTESWKADAEGILVFVRLRLLVPYFQLTHRSDWFILRRCRLFAFGVAPGSSTEPAGHVQLLPCQYIPASCRPESIQYFDFPPYFPASVFSTEFCGLGERALVHELSHQYHLCRARHVATTMGTKIPQSHTDTLQLRQASSDPFILS